MKLILTAEEQARAINEYIKREYNLDIKVYTSEYDDKDMEVEPVNRVVFGVGDEVRLAKWWLDRYDQGGCFYGTFTVRASKCPTGSTVVVRGETFYRDGRYKHNDTLPALILVE